MSFKKHDFFEQKKLLSSSVDELFNYIVLILFLLNMVFKSMNHFGYMVSYSLNWKRKNQGIIFDFVYGFCEE